MTGAVQGIADWGARGIRVEIECHISNNLPSIVIVGSASKSVDEAKERVRAAFANPASNFPASALQSISHRLIYRKRTVASP